MLISPKTTSLLLAALLALPLGNGTAQTTAPAAKATSAAADLPARLPSPTDTAVFRRFTLANGMRVLLVSDPKFNKSGASLVVNTGQIDDPKDSEGLAHFLEHMLFLGTEKYPDVNDYGNFITSNGGNNNAYTTTDHTNYQFQIRHEAFAGGLDRFAQFFIAPKFNPEFTSREVNAVHNEAMRHVQNDARRQFNVSRELYDPSSGESKFSTGNKDTLRNATPEKVRAFYESQYTADRMALSLAGKASLDELEKLARDLFSAVPKRDVTLMKHEATFLPKKAALRMAFIEPIKEVRQLTLEFVIPPTRADFTSKPDDLITDLISYPGAGGLVDQLKRDGLIVSLGSYVWVRTGNYGSLFVQANLTPAGQEQHAKVLARIMAYLDYLRASPYPVDFFKDRARIALLKESYGNRGEGSALATKLANQALFYPLEVAERATDVLGKPDESAYRRQLAPLTADNMLVSLMAKGVPTDRKERIYNTAYSYHEDTGAAYAALAKPEKVAFALPGTNKFMPGKSGLLAERPLPLISEKGIQLYYAADTEYQRPQTTLVFRFVPSREVGTAEGAALLQLYGVALNEAIETAVTDADTAGVQFSPSISIEGLKMTLSGYGDSPARFADYIAAKLRHFTITPARFEALKEVTLRGLRSYPQTEAYQLAGGRRDALSREFFFLPDELLPHTTTATWPKVQAFGQRYFARGKLEAVVHGHITADDAVAVTRSVAKHIGATPVAESPLLTRRHLVMAPGEGVIDAGAIEGVNSAFVSDYLLNDNSAATRAAAVVLANFISEPFYSELRTRQQLGYIVGSQVPASNNQRYLTFIVQSSVYAPDELRRRADALIATFPAALDAVSDAQWNTLVAGARSTLEQKPKSIAEKAENFFAAAFTFDRDWDRRQAALDALDKLTKADAVALLKSVLAPETAKRRTLLLNSKNHTPKEAIVATFTDRKAWKAKRKFN
jgi:insulysin